MGDKGARQSEAGAAMADRLLDELAPLGAVTAKKMFGGYGLFDDGVMFAIVDSTGHPYLRADETTAPVFVDSGSEKHGRMPYWRIPSEVLADPDQLLAWAGEARSVAVAAKKK